MEPEIFFIRLHTTFFLTTILSVPESERGKWATDFAMAIASNKPCSEYTKKLLDHAKERTKIAKENGRKGGINKANSSKAKARLKQKPSNPLASSSTSTKKEYAFNVMLSEEEYQKLVFDHGEPFVKKCIEKLSGYKESKGKIYKSDAGAMRTWVIDEVKKSWRTDTEVVY